jgi:OHCU decarboxylase
VRRVRLGDLNRMDREAFVEAVGWVFEGSPWVAEAVADGRPFPSLEALHEAMVRAVLEAPRPQQIALIRAHPELAAREPLSPASATEQRASGLAGLGPAERARLRDLQRRYRERFGFPFVIAVRDHTPEGILEALEMRLARTEEEEVEEALRQIARIAWHRLRDAVT